jgi:hypothetical protein
MTLTAARVVDEAAIALDGAGARRWILGSCDAEGRTDVVASGTDADATLVLGNLSKLVTARALAPVVGVGGDEGSTPDGAVADVDLLTHWSGLGDRPNGASTPPWPTGDDLPVVAPPRRWYSYSHDAFAAGVTRVATRASVDVASLLPDGFGVAGEIRASAFAHGLVGSVPALLALAEESRRDAWWRAFGAPRAATCGFDLDPVWYRPRDLDGRVLQFGSANHGTFHLLVGVLPGDGAALVIAVDAEQPARAKIAALEAVARSYGMCSAPARLGPPSTELDRPLRFVAGDREVRTRRIGDGLRITVVDGSVGTELDARLLGGDLFSVETELAEYGARFAGELVRSDGVVRAIRVFDQLAMRSDDAA